MIKCPDNLSDTVKYMNSTDYNERFLGEYFQLVIRLKKLQNILDKWKKNKLDFTPTSPYAILVTQANHMKAYRDILKARLNIEGIKI